MAAGLAAPLQARASNVRAVVAVGSQLVDRGLAITPATPVLQGAAAWTSATGRWSLGLSASAELRSPGRLDATLLQASRHWVMSDAWQMQASLLYYRYAGTARSRAYDRGEAGIHWIYRDTLTIGLAATRAFGTADHRTRTAADLALHWPLVRDVSFSVGAGIAQTLAWPRRDSDYDHGYGYGHGYSYRDNPPSVYRYGNAGLMWSKGPWRVQLDRIVTDLERNRQNSDLRAAPWVVTISRSF